MLGVLAPFLSDTVVSSPLQAGGRCPANTAAPGLGAIALVPLSQVKVAQSRPTLCDPMDYAVHGTLQARTLEWVAFPSSRGSFQPRDGAQVSRDAGGFFIS